MVITQDDFTWMFKDPDWKNKFLVGSLLALAATFIPLVGLLALLAVYGYALILMRAVMRGEPRFLPKWDDLGKMFVDGLQSAFAAVGYLLPGIIVFGCGFAFFFVAMFGGTFAAAATENARDAAGSSFFVFMLGQLGLFVTMGIAMFVWLAGTLVIPVAVGQYVRTGEIAAGYRWSEIWRILRTNASGFLVAWIMYFGVSLAMGFAVSILYYTIILCCLIPFLTAPITFYTALLFAQFFGAAYREGVSRAGLSNTPPPLPASI